MGRKLAFAVLLCSFSCSALEFNYARYEHSSIEALVERAAAFHTHEAGQSVLMPPQAVHLRGAVQSYPIACSDQLPNLLMRTIGIADPPAMKWCMSVKGEKGSVISLWVQDSFAHFVAEEYELDDEIELWALWLFVNASDRKPYFVVNAIGPAEEPEAEDGT
jgi:hypothetical protein